MQYDMLEQGYALREISFRVKQPIIRLRSASTWNNNYASLCYASTYQQTSYQQTREFKLLILIRELKTPCWS
nr:hypothetical protein Q903MT_gene3586 [Picea sitchensis]